MLRIYTTIFAAPISKFRARCGLLIETCEYEPMNVVNTIVFQETESKRVRPFGLVVLLRHLSGSLIKHTSNLTRRKIDTEVFSRYTLASYFTRPLAWDFVFTMNRRGWVGGTRPATCGTLQNPISIFCALAGEAGKRNTLDSGQ